MTDDVYIKLRGFLDGLPGGFPETDSGVELKILEKLFTPEEAEMAMQLNVKPEQVPAIASRAGLEEREAAELLDAMASRGLVFRARLGDGVWYLATNFNAGFYEFQLNNMDREFAELNEEYIPHFMVTNLTATKTGQFRVVPVEAAVESLSTVATYDRIRELVKEQQHIVVAQCICRKKKGLIGSDCNRPHETCFFFGINVQYYIENGLGREIDVDEALDLLAKAEEAALVLCTNNAQALLHLCCCCSCCCAILGALKTLNRPADTIRPSFQARIEPDLCSACGICLERCQVAAIATREECMEVDTDRCIGCGLCLSTCPEGSIAMVERAGSEAPPRTIFDMYEKILAERGLTI